MIGVQMPTAESLSHCRKKFTGNERDERSVDVDERAVRAGGLVVSCALSLLAGCAALAESDEGDAGGQAAWEVYVREQLAAFREIVARDGVRSALARPAGPHELLVAGFRETGA